MLLKQKKMKEETLKLCPFCGETPEIIMIGNDYTKTRKVEIRCPLCRIQRTDAAIKQTHEWLRLKAINKWNERV